MCVDMCTSSMCVDMCTSSMCVDMCTRSMCAETMCPHTALHMDRHYESVFHKTEIQNYNNNCDSCYDISACLYNSHSKLSNSIRNSRLTYMTQVLLYIQDCRIVPLRHKPRYLPGPRHPSLAICQVSAGSVAPERHRHMSLDGRR